MQSNRPTTETTPIVHTGPGSGPRPRTEAGESEPCEPMRRARLPESLFDYYLKPLHWDAF